MQLGQIGTRRLGRDFRFEVGGKLSLHVVVVILGVDLLVREWVPLDDGILSKDEVKLSQLFNVGVPGGSSGSFFEPFDEILVRDRVLPRVAVEQRQLGGLFHIGMLLKSGLHSSSSGGSQKNFIF